MFCAIVDRLLCKIWSCLLELEQTEDKLMWFVVQPRIWPKWDPVSWDWKFPSICFFSERFYNARKQHHCIRSDSIGTILGNWLNPVKWMNTQKSICICFLCSFEVIGPFFCWTGSEEWMQRSSILSQSTLPRSWSLAWKLGKLGKFNGKPRRHQLSFCQKITSWTSPWTNNQEMY